MADKKMSKTRVKKTDDCDITESLSRLIENVMDKSSVVLAAENITDELQDITKRLGMIMAKDVVEMYTSATEAFGEQVAMQFNKVSLEQIQGLITSVQNARSAIEKEIMRMKRGVENGDTTDMGMDMENDLPEPSPEPEMPEGDPNAPKMDAGLPEIPPDTNGNAEDDALGFAGRAKKESARFRGKRLNENNFDPALAPHPHKSMHYDTNLHSLSMFHNTAGSLARNIESMIDSDRLTGAERTGLHNVLSHIAMCGSDPSHWGSHQAKITSCLSKAGVDPDANENVKRIVDKLTQLGSLLQMHHEGLVESAMRSLRRSSDPDALILQTFRTKLAESRDAQLSAIRTARLFSIDVDDVVAVVRESAEKKRPFFISNICKKCKANNLPSAKICKECGNKLPKQVKEDGAPQLLQGTTMFPVQAGANPTPDPSISNPNGKTGPVRSTPPVGGPNQNPSTRKPLTPTDSRAAAQAQAQASAPPNRNVAAPQAPRQQQQTNGNVPPTNGQVQPTNQTQPPNAQRVKQTPAMPSGKVLR